MRRPLSLLAALFLALFAGLALSGCGPTATPTPPLSSEVQVAPAPVGFTLRIPALGVDTQLEPLERDDAGQLVPPPVTHPEVAGWYADGVPPGKIGPAIVAGHVSGRPEGAAASIPGVFAKLSTLAEGDTIEINQDGETLHFVVYAVDLYRKDAFPTGIIYGDTDGPELRLITCGGAFNDAEHSYQSNVAVLARLV